MLGWVDMNILILLLGTAGATLFWVLNRWTTRHDGRPALYSFWLLLVSAAVGCVLAAGFGQDMLDRDVWRLGVIIGLCYAGSLKLMLFCLQRGPSGPVVAVNNMGMVWPVTAAFLFPYPRCPSWLTVLGIFSVCIALILLGVARKSPGRVAPGNSAGTGSRAWSLGAAMLMLWVVAGLSMMFQAIAGRRLPDSPLALVSVMSLVACAAVLPMCARASRPRIRRSEVIPGIITGLVQVMTGFAILVGTARLGAQIVFPFIIATPIIIMLIVGHFVFKEALDRTRWAGCLLGAFGLVLLILSGS